MDAVKEIPTRVLRGTSFKFPELWTHVYVTGPQLDQKLFASLFAQAKCYKASEIEEADIVVFTGGQDVNPALYGQLQHDETRFNTTRDKEEFEIFRKCLELGIPMIGVCRGAQFLHVMNGGDLYQDVDNHQRQHSMYDTDKREWINRVSSVHHQMVAYKKGMDILGHANVSRKRYVSPTLSEAGAHEDIEAFYYRDTACFGVQGHPEYPGYGRFTQWFVEKIEELFAHNPDIEIRKSGACNGQWRLKEELLKERKFEFRKEIKEVMKCAD